MIKLILFYHILSQKNNFTVYCNITTFKSNIIKLTIGDILVCFIAWIYNLNELCYLIFQVIKRCFISQCMLG